MSEFSGLQLIVPAESDYEEIETGPATSYSDHTISSQVTATRASSRNSATSISRGPNVTPSTETPDTDTNKSPQNCTTAAHRSSGKNLVTYPRCSSAPNNKLGTVLAKMLYFGGFKQVNSVDTVASYGITAFLCVAAEAERPKCVKNEDLQSGAVIYKKLQMIDGPSTNLADYLPDAFTFLDEARQEGRRAVVYCAQGYSRSAAVVIAYLMRDQSISYHDALAIVRQERKADPNIFFCMQLAGSHFSPPIEGWETPCGYSPCRLPHFPLPTYLQTVPLFGDSIETLSKSPSLRHENENPLIDIQDQWDLSVSVEGDKVELLLASSGIISPLVTPQAHQTPGLSLN